MCHASKLTLRFWNRLLVHADLVTCSQQPDCGTADRQSHCPQLHVMLHIAAHDAGTAQQAALLTSLPWFRDKFCLARLQECLKAYTL